MEHSRIGLLLKAVVIGCGILAVAAYSITAYPFYNRDFLIFYPKIHQYYPYWVCLFAPSLIFILIALKSAWVIVNNIGNDNSFCIENSKRFGRICRLALIYAAYVFLLEVTCFLVFAHNPFLFISSMVITLVAVGIAVVCKVLAILLKKATDLQDEQSLTI